MKIRRPTTHASISREFYFIVDNIKGDDGIICSGQSQFITKYFQIFRSFHSTIIYITEKQFASIFGVDPAQFW